jgi:hypothetical protein
VKQETLEQFKRLDEQATEHISPSGLYRLVITPYNTGEGYWNYTEGAVYRELGQGPLEIVRRNYPHFWFAWAEKHQDGHDYLLCGEDYQGQTVIQLDSGKRVDYLPEKAAKGWAFCWIAVTPEENELHVDGCFWGGPEEHVVYDFSEPLELPYTELDRYFPDYDEEE